MKVAFLIIMFSLAIKILNKIFIFLFFFILLQLLLQLLLLPLPLLVIFILCQQMVTIGRMLKEIVQCKSVIDTIFLC